MNINKAINEGSLSLTGCIASGTGSFVRSGLSLKESKMDRTNLENCPNERISNGVPGPNECKVVGNGARLKALCEPFHRLSNPFCTALGLPCEAMHGQHACRPRSRRAIRKETRPQRSVDRRLNTVGAGPPGLHFRFEHNGDIKVVRGYLEYFDWNRLILQAGIRRSPEEGQHINGDRILSPGCEHRPIPSPKPATPDPGSLGNGRESSSSPSTPSTPASANGHAKERKNVLLSARRMSVNGGNSSRTCSSCGTNKTPYWRDGWGSPVVLCNACGLRYQKFKKYCWTCKYIPRKEEHSSERCANCKNNWK